MKFSSIFVVASVLAQQALVDARPFSDTASRGHIVARQQNNFRNGGNRNQNQGGNRFGGNRGGNNNGGFRGGNRNGGGNRGQNRSTSSAAPATSTSAAQATASAGNNGGNGGDNQDGGENDGGDGGQNGGNGGNQGDNNGGNQGGNNGGNEDPQTTLQLDPSLIGPNLAQDGLAAGEPGQVASLTSTNNYINFCQGQTITNGQQVQGGSCNPVPMGQIPARERMPSCKFVFPPNGGTVTANEDFTVQLAVRNLITGQFVNAQTNYFSAPQQLQGGVILAHSHVVIEKLSSLDQTQPTDPSVFEFFKGLNLPDANGVLSATVTGGLEPGFYKVSSINTAANHQPVLGPVAQHGSFDDVSYFTVE